MIDDWSRSLLFNRLRVAYETFVASFSDWREHHEGENESREHPIESARLQSIAVTAIQRLPGFDADGRSNPIP